MHKWTFVLEPHNPEYDYFKNPTITVQAKCFRQAFDTVELFCNRVFRNTKYTFSILCLSHIDIDPEVPTKDFKIWEDNKYENE